MLSIEIAWLHGFANTFDRKKLQFESGDETDWERLVKLERRESGVEASSHSLAS